MKHNKKTRKNKKKRTIKRKKLIIRGGNTNTSDITYVFTIIYRARAGREKRRDQLQACIENIITSFTKYNKKFKIIIVEQNNDLAFNLGILHNIGFIEGEKMFNFPKLYFHNNVDYYFDNTKDFPKDLENFTGDGFFDIYILHPADNRLGALCCFGPESYKKINGFPNDMTGHGPYDIILRYRVDKLGVPYKKISEPGWIYDDDDAVERDAGTGDVYAIIDEQKAKPIDTNGLSTCVYTIDGRGEFNDESKGIIHLLANFTNK